MIVLQLFCGPFLSVAEFIKLFRPDRDGMLTVLDFAKTVDTVYKEIKLLRANVLNSSKVGREDKL